MKRSVLVSLAIIAAISLAFASQATAKEKTKKVVLDEKKLKKIEDTGAFLGVYMGDLDDDARKDADYPKSSGVLVTSVIDESPAEEAGIEEGDIIYLFDGETVESGKQLGELVTSHKPGDKIEIVLYRDGKKKTVDVALAEKKTSYLTIDMDEDGPVQSYMVMKKLGEPGMAMMFGGKDGKWSFVTDRPVLGVSLHDISEDLAPYFDVKPGQGVLVLDVHEDTPAAEAGIKGGDVIVEIAGAKVTRYNDVIDALADVDEDTTVTVTVVRSGKKIDIPVEVEREGLYSVGLSYQPGSEKALKDMKYNMIIPETKAIRIKEIEEQKLEQRMKELEKQLEELQEKLKKMDKAD
jgi:C-terminal processing protease CtpA/Prc